MINNNNMLQKIKIQNHLALIKHLPKIDSTNTYLKAKAELGAPSFSCVVADMQTAGKGRMGNDFYSPAENGLYMSLLLRPCSDLSGQRVTDAGLITACAAVAVREAIKNITDKDTNIKWVNDLYYEGKKVCGILAEGAYSPILNGYEYIVLGIGINICGSFEDTELNDIATALYTELDQDELFTLKDDLTSEILNVFISRYLTQITDGGKAFFDTYKDALFIIDKEVTVLQGGKATEATVVDLNEDFTLKVKYKNGKTASINSGEVKLKI